MNLGLINRGEPQPSEGKPTVDHKHLIAECITCVLLGEVVQRKAEQGRGYADIGHKAVRRTTLREQAEHEESQQRAVGIGGNQIDRINHALKRGERNSSTSLGESSFP